jgi:hypothetical protein
LATKSTGAAVQFTDEDGAEVVASLKAGEDGFWSPSSWTYGRLLVLRRSFGFRTPATLFRHTMATLMLEGGADIRYIPGDAECGVR